MKLLLALFITGMIASSCKEAQPHFLEINGDKIISNHALKFELQKPNGFRIAEPVTHYPTFNEHPFKVSLGGFIADSEAVLVHAEEVLDKAGTLDYPSLPRDTLSNIEFGIRFMCAELTEEEIQEEHDILYLKKHGFTLQPGVFLIQFLKNTDDMNMEYILSYATTVPSCSVEADTDFKESVRKRVQSIVELKKLN
jgi:hypothetical protein